MMSRKRLGLLIAERDGDWGDWIGSLGSEVDEVVVVVQRRSETAASLATRVRRRVDSIRAEGEVVAAALVGGDDWDPSILSARSLMIRSVVSQMVSSRSGRLYLDAGTRFGRGRHAMQALASVVEEQILDTGVEVCTTAGTAPAPGRPAPAQPAPAQPAHVFARKAA